MAKINLLVNLPEGFFRTPALEPIFQRMETFAALRKTSHNMPEEIREDLAWADAVLMWSWPKLDDDLLDAAPKLQMAAQLDVSQSAGQVAIKRGFPVSQGRHAWSPAVAELALGLMLSTLRKISSYHMAMRAGTEQWVGSFPDSIDPQERQLTGRAVGIIGLGGVGRRLAELLGPFHVDLRVYDPFLPDGVAEQYNGRRGELMDLMKNSEVVVLCAASNAGTKHLLGREQIDAMPAGAVLVNVARAALVDTDALVDRLKRNDLYAAVDVFDKEPTPADHPLRKLPNAFLTPHRAGGVMESVQRILTMLVDDLEAHLAGKPRRHPLTEAMIPSLDA